MLSSDNAAGSTEEQLAPETKRECISHWRLATILGCVGIGLFLSLMDATLVATMLLDITHDFGGFQKSQWIVLSYTLLDGGIAVFLARLSDIVGRKVIICASFAIFIAGSMACGASRSLDQLIGFRALQGAAAAGLYTTSVVVYFEMAPPRLIILIFAVIGTIVALAGMAGPIIGGLLATNVGWRWAFWINGPCALFALVLLMLLWQEGEAHKTARAKLSIYNLDAIGAVLILAGVTLPIFITSQASIGVYSWSSPTTISVLVLSVVTWICLVAWQRYMSTTPRFANILPQLPWEILSNRILLAALIDTILASYVLSVAIFHVPIRAQVKELYDAVQSGFLLLPLLGGGAVGAAAAGIISHKKNLMFWVLSASSLLMIIASTLLSKMPESGSCLPQQRGYLAILGFGVGMNIATTTLLATLHSDMKNHGM